MALKYILHQLGVKMGLDPSVDNERQVLLRITNEACLEVYNKSDMAGCLMEQYFKINGDQTITLPEYVGHVRAIRESDTYIAWHLVNQRARYNQYNWSDVWRSYRDKGISALQCSIRNQSKVLITVGTVETPPITVSISGSTLQASSISEQIVMDSVQKQSVNNYLDITSLKKDRVNSCDVYMNDIDNIQLSMIANNLLEARYRIIDVSLFPFQNNDAGQADHYLEVLYKKTLPWMENDNDEFPAPGYDNIIVNKGLQLWNEEQGKVQEALAYDQKATRSLAEKHEDENREKEDVVGLCANGHDNLLVKIRPRRRVYRGWWRGPYGY